MVATSPCWEKCWVWTLPPGPVLISSQCCFNAKRVVSSPWNSARYLLPTSVQGRSLAVGRSQAPTCFSSLALRILSAPWHNFNRKGWEVAYSLGRDRWIWISLRRRRTQTRVRPLLREELKPLRYYTKTTTPVICILSSEHKAASRGLSNRAGLTPPAGFGARSVGAARGMQHESWGMGGRRAPRSPSRHQCRELKGEVLGTSMDAPGTQGVLSRGWKLLDRNTETK